MDMHLGSCLFDCPKQIAIVIRIQIAGQAALYADFAGSQLPRFQRPALDLLERMKVSVILARRPAKSAEVAPDETDIREVDVAIDDIGDHVADSLAAQLIGGTPPGSLITAFYMPSRHSQEATKTAAHTLAEELGAYPEVVEAAYRALVAGFVAREQTDFAAMEPVGEGGDR